MHAYVNLNVLPCFAALDLNTDSGRIVVVFLLFRNAGQCRDAGQSSLAHSYLIERNPLMMRLAAGLLRRFDVVAGF